VLKECLDSFAQQDYPPERLEIIVADGGSTDGTTEIARQYGGKIVSNPLQTGEAGKAAGLKHACHELVALIDSDNVLPNCNWLRKMVEPFSDPEIVASEPIEYTYRSTDSWINRYCAMLGMNDPLCLFCGNYDRYSILTGRWTDLRLATEDRGDYLKVTLRVGDMPTIGANGFVIRRE
jgi:glycosyltransferase involved in cell wall biosynthesis